MKSFALALALVVAAAATLPAIAEARRIGGGGAAGMQRSVPPRAAPEAIPARPATAPAATPAAAAAPAAAAGKRSWLGPIAGLAAGLGIAALMSHMGLGAEFGNIIMMALIAGIAFFVIRLLMRKFMPGNAAAGQGGMQLATAGAGAPVPKPQVVFPDERPAQFRGLAAGAEPVVATAAAVGGAVVAASLPVGFDAPAFERVAKMIFIRMQAANDAADLDDLRRFTTPELFASLRLDLQERGPAAQSTDVVKVDAKVLDIGNEADRQIVSVRFEGQIIEEKGAAPTAFSEVWHLVRPHDASRDWAIAGIEQLN